jgi:hypothetical protein
MSKLYKAPSANHSLLDGSVMQINGIINLV